MCDYSAPWQVEGEYPEIRDVMTALAENIEYAGELEPSMANEANEVWMILLRSIKSKWMAMADLFCCCVIGDNYM